MPENTTDTEQEQGKLRSLYADLTIMGTNEACREIKAQAARMGVSMASMLSRILIDWAASTGKN